MKSVVTLNDFFFVTFAFFVVKLFLFVILLIMLILSTLFLLCALAPLREIFCFIFWILQYQSPLNSNLLIRVNMSRPAASRCVRTKLLPNCLLIIIPTAYPCKLFASIKSTFAWASFNPQPSTFSYFLCFFVAILGVFAASWRNITYLAYLPILPILTAKKTSKKRQKTAKNVKKR